jgi:hypothetical protein
MQTLAPLIAPALWKLERSGDYKIIDITEPLPGWQHAVLQRIHAAVGPGSSILTVTVLPNGVTHILDPYMLTSGIFTCFAAALRYLEDEQPLDGTGITIDFPQSP